MELRKSFRLTIFREGNKTAKHIPDILDFSTLEFLDKQVELNNLDIPQTIDNRSEIIKLQMRMANAL